ncbi:hypothetical protein NHX12_006826 [Muraenolepis orangiensis]|uniref:Uncharacterized protein n=1 Tax=Muraenolepis orangiensis TaxID=630683 RepID=A0A9Q0DLT0_9TELE|nr:hypothetical protein NHX12_006826 [Muraenolepis orangiensis]
MGRQCFRPVTQFHLAVGGSSNGPTKIKERHTALQATLHAKLQATLQAKLHATLHATLQATLYSTLNVTLLATPCPTPRPSVACRCFDVVFVQGDLSADRVRFTNCIRSDIPSGGRFGQCGSSSLKSSSTCPELFQSRPQQVPTRNGFQAAVLSGPTPDPSRPDTSRQDQVV